MTSVRFVLVRPRIAENLGAAARALKNFGFAEWTWVSPQVEALEPARRLAVHADELLASAARTESLASAVSDCTWVVGTSSRHVRGKRRLSPRDVAALACDRRLALVFGDERSGLTNEEIDLCHDLSAVPTDATQPSINLAQSVLLYAWELSQALRDAPASAPRARKASAHDVDQLERSLEELLTAGQFLIHRERHALRDLRGTLVRAELSEREAKLWTAALRAVRKRLP